MMMTEQIFANNFWGLKDDGFHVLTAKMNSTKKTFDEIKSFYSVRASLHEEFGRKLMKHAKVGMGREETGTLQALLSSAHKEMEWTAQAHLNLAQKLKIRLEVDLDNFILAQKDKRKLAHTNVEKAHRYKQSNEAYLSKAKEKYESDCAKLITLQSQVTTATGREAERIKQRIDRTQHEIKIQEQEYKNACIKVADATEAWNRTWKITCDTYQGMEKKRLEFLHHSFSMYINVLSTATSQDQESYERFWKSLDQYDPMNDLQIFIHEKGTGPKIPEPEVFVDYMDDPTKTFQQHTLANFPCPPELLTENNTPTDPQPSSKPELTVRNPTALQTIPSVTSTLPSEEGGLQRMKSNRVKPNPITTVLNDPPKPSKSSSTSERRRSIIQTTVKPLPSISTPSIQKKKSIRESYNTKLQQSTPSPPVIAVPESSCSSTTSASEEDTTPISTTASRKLRSERKHKEEGDIAIDPRAKVVFAIGKNMFDLGHLDLEEKSKLDPSSSTARRATTSRRRRQPSADIEAACNFSYQSLLEELGVFDKNEANNTKKVIENETPRRISNRIPSQRERKSSIRKAQAPMTEQIVPQQQDSYTITSEPYRQQQQPVIVPQQPYYNQYNTQPTPQPMGQTMNHTMNQTMAYSNTMYNPPSSQPQLGQKPTLFWAMALGDWYSGKLEELQYSRGTWLAVTETRPDGWYYATKYDSRLSMLTNETGYVAQNYVQVHHS